MFGVNGSRHRHNFPQSHGKAGGTGSPDDPFSFRPLGSHWCIQGTHVHRYLCTSRCPMWLGRQSPEDKAGGLLVCWPQPHGQCVPGQGWSPKLIQRPDVPHMTRPHICNPSLHLHPVSLSFCRRACARWPSPGLPEVARKMPETQLSLRVLRAAIYIQILDMQSIRICASEQM